MLFSKEDEARITGAIRDAEHRTSGEIRVYVEDFCLRDQPVERAAELFHLFGMFNTKARNGVLVYLAEKSRQFAIWGDTGIHAQVGFQFWASEKQLLRSFLQQDQAAEGVCQVIAQIGEKLSAYFPADEKNNDNELPDEIIYG
ncbi:MAG: TPM domain-containing protein [Bacteroidota bacterium]